MKERRIELAVLGYRHRRTRGEIILGTTARYVVNRAPCHIVLNIPRRD
jgi:nucleotide-binding universal stress UspA family protein